MAKPQTKQIGARLPVALVDWLDETASQNGVTRTDVLEAAARYLKSASATAPMSPAEALVKELTGERPAR